MHGSVSLRPLGGTGLAVPPFAFGTRSLGNELGTIPFSRKMAICSEWFKQRASPVFIDACPKFGAELALEALRSTLNRFEISPNEVVIGIRLGSNGVSEADEAKRSSLEAGRNDHRVASTAIDYDGIIAGWEASCRLLGKRFAPQLVSLHVPDNCVDAEMDSAEREQRADGVFGAIRALNDLKVQGRVRGIGISSTSWPVVRAICESVRLDWVLLQCCPTVRNHDAELMQFLAKLESIGVAIINSSVFHGGFLVGGSRCDGREIRGDSNEGRSLLAWRRSFVSLCEAFGTVPAHACIQFGLSAPGIAAVVLDSPHPEQIAANIQFALNVVPNGFWAAMKDEGLVAEDYPYVG